MVVLGQSAASPLKDVDTALNVVVVGGSSGIGRCIVEKFAKMNHRVFATYYSQEEGIASLQKKYPRIAYGPLDQGDLSSIERFGEAVKEWLESPSDESSNNRRVDILVNNAALGSATVVKYIQAKLANEGKLESFSKLTKFRQQAMEDEALLRVNAMGPLWVTDIITPMLRSPARSTVHRNYATILFMGSVGGSVGVFPEYRASDLMSKSAVTYLSQHLAASHVHSHVDVLCLAPGATRTEMFQSSTLDRLADLQRFMQQMPKSRLIEPEEIAQSVYALTTEKWARIFHGGVLDASLGLGVRPGLQTESTVERIEC